MSAGIKIVVIEPSESAVEQEIIRLLKCRTHMQRELRDLKAKIANLSTWIEALVIEHEAAKNRGQR